MTTPPTNSAANEGAKRYSFARANPKTDSGPYELGRYGVVIAVFEPGTPESLAKEVVDTLNAGVDAQHAAKRDGKEGM